MNNFGTKLLLTCLLNVLAIKIYNDGPQIIYFVIGFVNWFISATVVDLILEKRNND